MSLANRLNQIIEEQKISKKEFAGRIGVSENYLYILTSNSRPGTPKKTKPFFQCLPKSSVWSSATMPNEF